MCVLECFLIGDFLVGDPPPAIFFGFLVTNKTRVANIQFPALLIRPGNRKAQHETVYSEEAFSFSFDIYLEQYYCDPFTENLC